MLGLHANATHQPSLAKPIKQAIIILAWTGQAPQKTVNIQNRHFNMTITLAGHDGVCDIRMRQEPVWAGSCSKRRQETHFEPAQKKHNLAVYCWDS